MEIYTSPLPPPQIRDRKIVRFGFCAASSLIWGGGGVGNSTFWLLRTFILDLVGVGWVIARFGFCAPSSFIWGWGWGGVGWLAVPFYSVQDCRQDFS